MTVALPACGACVLEGAAEWFPPVLPWTAISPVWYLVLCVFSRVNGFPLPGMGSLWKGVALLLGGLLLGAAVLGPWSILPFGVVAAVATRRLHRESADLSGGARAAGRAITLAAILSLVLTGVLAFASA